MTEAVPSPLELKPGLPPDVVAIVLRCLEKEPEDRFPDVRALEAALANCSLADAWTQEMAADWWASTAAESLAEPDLSGKPGDQTMYLGAA